MYNGHLQAEMMFYSNIVNVNTVLLNINGEIRCLSSQVFFLLCSSHRYNIQNIKFSLFMWRVIFAYLDSHEKVCLQNAAFLAGQTVIADEIEGIIKGKN